VADALRRIPEIEVVSVDISLGLSQRGVDSATLLAGRMNVDLVIAVSNPNTMTRQLQYEVVDVANHLELGSGLTDAFAAFGLALAQLTGEVYDIVHKEPGAVTPVGSSTPAAPPTPAGSPTPEPT